MAVTEARILETDGGPGPEGTGWFVVNVDDTVWWRNDVFGASCPSQANQDEKRRKANVADARFQEDGINIHVVSPDQPNCVVGAGDGPCAILMVGTRTKPGVVYPVSEVASRRGVGVGVGVGVEEQTRLPRNAYARFPEWERVRLEDVGLPWK